ncbi:heterokaryon incompatibility protein [Stagonosporopsis vannaccii]|nr:heterokaryon incompatibility protein [Stagonosporopsis vannaccii]
MLNDSFCAPCKALLTGQQEPCGTYQGAQVYLHHADASSFRDALELQCPLCVRLRAMMGPFASLTGTGFNEPRVDRQYHLGSVYKVDFLHCPKDTCVDSRITFDSQLATFRLTSSKGKQVRVHLRAHTLTETSAMTFLPEHQPLSFNTVSGSALDFLASSLRTCQTSHAQCQFAKSISTEYTPTRLLDVGNPDNDLIHLQEGGEIDQDSSYVALSHCWGTTQVMVLSTETEPMLRRGVNIRALPKTFRDAVYVCRRFGLRYLWIDSLCIRQDNKEDWATESRRMWDVYGQAAFTIAATGAENSHVGLFFDRGRPRMPPVLAEINWPEPDDREANFTPPPGTYFIGDFTGEYEDIQQSPLNVRAWVLQERYLSPRIMHFARGMLYWECHELFASELYPDGYAIPNPLTQFFDFRLLKSKNFTTRILATCKILATRKNLRSKDGLAASLKSISLISIYRDWLKLRAMYTHCERTREEDMLVALAGIAEEVTNMLSVHLPAVRKYSRPETDNIFIAGMWKPLLLTELCWSVAIRPTGVADKPEKWRAPTWSWATSNCVVVGSKSLMKLDRAWVGPRWSWSRSKGQNDGRVHAILMQSALAKVIDVRMETISSGEPKEGFLRLGCHPFPVKVRSSPNGKHGAFDNPLSTDAGPNNKAQFIPQIAFDSSVYSVEAPMFAVILTFVQGAVEGLVLQRAAQQSEAYERVGHFHSSDLQDPDVPAGWIRARHAEAKYQVITIV